MGMKLEVVIDWASEVVGCGVDVDVENVFSEGPTDDVGGIRDTEDIVEPDEDCEWVLKLEARESGVDEDTTFVVWIVCSPEIDSDNDVGIEIPDVERVDPP